MTNLIVDSLHKYTRDVQLFISSPGRFLLGYTGQGNERATANDALLFLVVSAVLSATLQFDMKPLDSMGSDGHEGWWFHTWVSFRSHVFPAILFTGLQTLLASTFGGANKTHFFVSYARAYAVLLVMRSVVSSVLHEIPDVSIWVSTATLVALTITIAISKGSVPRRRVLPLLLVTTLLNAYIIAMVEMAADPEEEYIGLFEPIVMYYRTIGPRPTALEGSRPTALELTPGRQFTEALNFNDDIEYGKYTDIWTFHGVSGRVVAVDVASSEFDTYVQIKSPDGQILVENDDAVGDFGTDSRVTTALAQTGAHQVIVTSYEPYETGAYEVKLSY